MSRHRRQERRHPTQQRRGAAVLLLLMLLMMMLLLLLLMIMLLMLMLMLPQVEHHPQHNGLARVPVPCACAHKPNPQAAGEEASVQKGLSTTRLLL